MRDPLTRTLAVVSGYLAEHRPAWRLPEVTADSAFRADLACDPIDLVCICLALEDEFAVQLPPDEPEHCETVADLARWVARVERRAA